MASTSKKIVAEALRRIVARNMAAGRSLAYDRMLAELAVEVDELLEKRREREARLQRRARKEVREDQAVLAAVAESRAAVGVEQEFSSVVPSWHPEHPENDL